MTRNIPSHRSRRRSAFTLLEAVTAVIVLSLAVPPTLAMLRASSGQHADAVRAVMASWGAQSALEFVLADASSPNAALGMAGVAAGTYVDTGAGGIASLRTRVAPGLSPAITAGSLEVLVGALVSPSGATTGDPTRDIFRVVRVGVPVTFEDADSTVVRYEVMLSGL